MTNLTYSTISPIATYSPWIGDEKFNEIYSIVFQKKTPWGHWTFTQVDIYRAYELWTLVKETSKLKEGAIIEIGTWCGGSGAIIGKGARDCGVKDKIYMCDTFKGIVKVDGNKDSHMKNGMLDDATFECVDYLMNKLLKIEDVKILEGIFPEETQHNIPNYEKFRFCHIDVDVYYGCKDIVDWIWEKMVPGGIIVYDDFGFSSADGVTKYVEEQRQFSDRLVIHNLNGHAVVIKL